VVLITPATPRHARGAASTTTGLVLAMNHAFVSWAVGLLDDLRSFGSWQFPENTVCIAEELLPQDYAVLQPRCTITPTVFRHDPTWEFVQFTYKRHAWWTPPPRYKGHTTNLINYTFVPAWNRMDILLEDLYRRFEKVIYLDCDTRVTRVLNLDADFITGGKSIAIALEHAINGLNRYRDFYLALLPNASKRKEFETEFPPSANRPRAHTPTASSFST